MSNQTELEIVGKTTDFLTSARWLETGDNFFEELVKFLAEILEVEIISVDQLMNDGTIAESLVVLADGQIKGNFRYSLENTPCGEVIKNGVCSFPTGITKLFPEVEMFKTLHADGYAGVSLQGFDGQVIGLIAVVSRKPISNPGLTESILKMAGVRASGELELHKMEEDLRIKQFLIDHMADSAIWIREDGSVSYMNESARKMLGYTEEEIQGLSVMDFTEGYNVESWKERWNFLKNVISSKFERNYRRKNGEIFPVEISANYFEVHGESRLYGIIRDISIQTERERKIKESEEKFAKIFHNSPYVVMITSMETGKILDVNNSIQRFGYLRDEIVGVSTMTLKLWANPADRETLIRRLLDEGHVFNFEAQFQKKNGEIFFGLISAEFMDLNDATVILSVMHNIHDLKETEKMLRENEKRLRELNMTKDRFFSLIAHDLRSPFNSIIGFSDLLVEQMNTKDYVGIEKYANIIHKSAHRVMDLLNNLLDWSRTQTGSMQFNPEFFEMRSLVKEVVELMMDTANHKSVQVHNDLPAYLVVNADKGMIYTILRNLLSNAVKFSVPDSKVVITGIEKNNETIITIKDSGVGIPAELREKLFRVDHSFSTPGTNNEKGSGLGLIICREFIEKHGGQISVTSEPGKGSEFSFSIPQTV